MNATETVRALSALAHEARLAVFRLLVQAGPAGLSAGTLAERLGVAPSALSFHLKELTQASLIEPRPDGRRIHYSARFAAMNELMGYLTENCCGGENCDMPAAAGVCC